MESATRTEAASTERTGGNGRPAAAESFEVLRPFDGTVIEKIAVDSPQRVADVVARVRAVQPAWQGLGYAGRRRWLAEWRDWMFDNHERIADLMQAETGKVRAEAEGEVPVVASAINYYASNGERFIADETPGSSFLPLKVKQLRVVRRPYEVVGVISPWNFPLILSLEDAVPALFAGAAVVIKPSEITPLAVREAIRGWKEEVGAPDVLDLVNGVAETGGALVDECDFIQFTGSEATGKVVMKRAADTLTPVSLELGGKDPMVVLADSDVDRAVNAAAWGGLANAGQVCMSIERVYVEEPVYDEFVDRLAARVRELKQGADGREYAYDIGAMTSPEQTGVVEEHVADAREKGARILTGGKRREGPGDFYEPTVIADADHSMKVMRDETFGPVIAVGKAADPEEAVRLANDTRYGLSATVFAGDADRGVEIARRIEAGAVNVNDVLTNYYAIDLPMGGWKSSGIGRRHGPDGIRKYTRSEAIVSPRVKQGKADPLWFPYTTRRRRLAGRFFNFFVARGLRRRLGL
jgi:acyl-CoA reductase-like NAD-dependent aldehyde dehydrogenase